MEVCWGFINVGPLFVHIILTKFGFNV